MWHVRLVVAAMLAGGLTTTAAASERATPAPVQAPTPIATPEPLDEATLRSLRIMAFAPGNEPSSPTIIFVPSESVELQPGNGVVLVLGVLDLESCLIGYRCFTPVLVNARWSVSPQDGADIDAATRVLTIAPDTPNGSIFTVRADVESGRRLVETEVYVYTPEGNPFVGTWAEQAQLTCGSDAPLPPELPIQELTFAADGTFNLAWTPFESYVDYWGTYEFDSTQGTVALTVTGGNFVPPDMDGTGRFALDEAGQLILSDLWLGTPSPERVAATPGPGNAPAACGHRFVSLTSGQ